MSGRRRVIIVAVVPDQASVVASSAVELAEELGADVVAMEERLEQVVAGRSVRWSVEHLGGDPSRELAHLADRVGAWMFVVGTRRPGWRGRVEEFFSGSVAVRLAHHQHRPVMVVPAAPVGFERPAPWE